MDPLATILQFAGEAPFPLHPYYTGVAIGYPSGDKIADQVMPYFTVDSQQFIWEKWDLGESWRPPNTVVKRRGKVNRVEFSYTEVSATTVNHALDDSVPIDDIKNAKPPRDPLGRAVIGITELLMIAREIEVAGYVQDTANYAAGQSTTLGAGTQFDDPTVNPIPVMLGWLDTPPVRPNIVTIGRESWTKMRTNPYLVQYGNANAGTGGAITIQQLKDLLEVDQINIGASFSVTSRKGAAATTKARIWGKHMAMHYRHPQFASGGGPAWGATARWGDRVAAILSDVFTGMKGAQIPRVGESTLPVVFSTDFGYLAKSITT